MHFFLSKWVIFHSAFYVLLLVSFIFFFADDVLVFDEVRESDDHLDGQYEREQDEQSESDEELDEQETIEDD